jgi:hypothetical protein
MRSAQKHGHQATLSTLIAVLLSGILLAQDSPKPADPEITGLVRLDDVFVIAHNAGAKVQVVSIPAAANQPDPQISTLAEGEGLVVVHMPEVGGGAKVQIIGTPAVPLSEAREPKTGTGIPGTTVTSTHGGFSVTNTTAAPVVCVLRRPNASPVAVIIPAGKTATLAVGTLLVVSPSTGAAATHGWTLPSSPSDGPATNGHAIAPQDATPPNPVEVPRGLVNTPSLSNGWSLFPDMNQPFGLASIDPQATGLFTGTLSVDAPTISGVTTHPYTSEAAPYTLRIESKSINAAGLTIGLNFGPGTLRIGGWFGKFEGKGVITTTYTDILGFEPAPDPGLGGGDDVVILPGGGGADPGVGGDPGIGMFYPGFVIPGGGGTVTTIETVNLKGDTYGITAAFECPILRWRYGNFSVSLGATAGVMYVQETVTHVNGQRVSYDPVTEWAGVAGPTFDASLSLGRGISLTASGGWIQFFGGQLDGQAWTAGLGIAIGF